MFVFKTNEQTKTVQCFKSYAKQALVIKIGRPQLNANLQ